MTHPTEGSTASPPQTDPDAAYRAFMEHIAGYYKCRHRDVNCRKVKPIKDHLREIRNADVAGQAALR
ncbi:hypothetical protein [Streptomyces niveus]|uniref:hypothetical protein n=1 Tax=Streptomyces niveus TaxID=193462 RepID=UPI00368955A7